jgi:signal peptidase I
MLPQAAAHPAAQPLRIPAEQPLRIRTEARRRARRRVKSPSVISSLMLSSVVLFILVVIAGMLLGAWRFNVIDTGSMRPTLNPGDVAVLRSEDSAALRPGQIIAFHPPGEPRLTVVHRVFSVRRVRGGVIIQTRGDANNTPDAWRARITGNTVWHESLKVPVVGYLAVWSQQRPVRLALLIAIVTILVSILLGSIWRSDPSEASKCRAASA